MATLDLIKVGSTVQYKKTGLITDTIIAISYKDCAFKKAIVTNIERSRVSIVFEDSTEETLLNIFDGLPNVHVPITVSDEQPTKGHINSLLAILKQKCKMVGEPSYIRFDTAKSKDLINDINRIVELLLQVNQEQVGEILVESFSKSIHRIKQDYYETCSETCKSVIELLNHKIGTIGVHSFTVYWKDLFIPQPYHKYFKGE